MEDLTPHTYQYTFASNPRWSRFYPPGAEFENYLRVVAKKFGVYDNTKFLHKFLTAKWIEEDGEWEVTLLRLEDNTVSLDISRSHLCVQSLTQSFTNVGDQRSC